MGWRSIQQHPLLIDLVFYLTCFVYAIIVAFTNEFYGFRIWGNFAMVGYGVALLHTCWLYLSSRSATPTTWWRSRWFSISAVFVVGMLAPLVTLVIRRLTGIDWLYTPSSWSAQPEVWVIERSAQLLFDHGTPFTDVYELGRAVEVNDYTPYGPVMTIFGMPRALFGGHPIADALTDARLMFALTAVACVLVTLKLLGWPRIPVLGAQLAAIFPFTALTFAVAGPDLPMVGLVIVAVALAARKYIAASAVVAALVSSAKLIPFLATPVLIIFVIAVYGRRAGIKFGITWLAVALAANVPVFLVDPKAFIEHQIRFPAGLGAVSSPAASPLPGHLIASTGALGEIIAFALLGLAAVAIGAWLIRRPPLTGSDTLFRIAVGLAAFTLLTTATRFGYFVYPTVLVGAALCFRHAELHQSRSNPPLLTSVGQQTS